eukprot:GHVN01106843.1.p2 GENE.GHVN01106843.1~~GHVN01106843.1.p2  ORF type:complete len:305 (+),score=69.76 GHVN01106843.1:800-1714(+)
MERGDQGTTLSARNDFHQEPSRTTEQQLDGNSTDLPLELMGPMESLSEVTQSEEAPLDDSKVLNALNAISTHFRLSPDLGADFKAFEATLSQDVHQSSTDGGDKAKSGTALLFEDEESSARLQEGEPTVGDLIRLIERTSSQMEGETGLGQVDGSQNPMVDAKQNLAKVMGTFKQSLETLVGNSTQMTKKNADEMDLVGLDEDWKGALSDAVALRHCRSSSSEMATEEYDEDGLEKETANSEEEIRQSRIEISVKQFNVTELRSALQQSSMWGCKVSVAHKYVFVVYRSGHIRSLGSSTVGYNA